MPCLKTDYPLFVPWSLRQSCTLQPFPNLYSNCYRIGSSYGSCRTCGEIFARGLASRTSDTYSSTKHHYLEFCYIPLFLFRNMSCVCSLPFFRRMVSIFSLFVGSITLRFAQVELQKREISGLTSNTFCSQPGGHSSSAALTHHLQHTFLFEELVVPG